MDIGIASILNLSSLGGIIYFVKNYRDSKKMMEEIKENKVSSPSRWLARLDHESVRSNLKKSEENPHEHIIKGFVEGYVNCEKPLKSKIDGKTPLVYSLYVKNDIYSNESDTEIRSFPKKLDERTKASAPLYFALRDPQNQEFCLIHRSLDVDATDCLEHIAGFT